ncbi:MAG: hypothetical protein IPL00_05890 [Gammaproteobacteria bacterium]|nr:hypothetical protein [Gammaproteobacteria bacterium]
MKGSLHTDELMAAVVARDGVCAPRAASATYLMDAVLSAPAAQTDAAVNVAPDVSPRPAE